MMTGTLRSRLLTGAWIAVAVQVAGQLLDLRWHRTHPGFETASDQLAAHWLIWIGVLAALIVAIIGARYIPSRWYVGYRLLLLVVAVLIAAEIWHFWEHYNHHDPPAPHVVLVIGKAAILAGAISVTLLSRRRPAPH